MTKEFEKYRLSICELYLGRNLKLDEVQKQMRLVYGFDAKKRAYYNHLTSWGALKKDNRQADSPIPAPSPNARSTSSRTPRNLLQRNQGRACSPASALFSDSGYGTESYRNSIATSRSTPWSDNTSVSDIQTNLLKLSFQGSPAPTSVYSNGAFPTSLASGGDQRTGPLGHLPLTLQTDISLSSQSDDTLYNAHLRTPTDVPIPNIQKAGPFRHLQTQQPLLKGPDLSIEPSYYSSPHAPPSRCRLARDDLSVPIVDPQACQFCGATELHYLATISHSLGKEIIFERIRDAAQRIELNQSDIFENNPAHFLAGSGPTWENFRLFYRAGFDLFKRNLDGVNFLHALDPIRLGQMLPALLMTFEEERPGFLTQRTCHGKSVLHCLLEQSYFLSRSNGLDTLAAILPIFQIAKNDFNARDNQGHTAMEVFCERWLAATKLDDRSLEELETFQRIRKTFAPDLRLKSLGDGHFSAVTLCNGRIPCDLAPTGRESKDHSLANLELRDFEMRGTIVESQSNPLAHDYRARNGIHCLASAVRPFSDVAVQPLAVRKETLISLMDRGVDINAYDRAGSTPLHTFLSWPRSHDEDNTIALFIKLMVLRERGADLRLRDRQGNDPLHLACKSGLVPCVDILLAMGANVDTRNYAGRGVIAEAQLEMRTCGLEDAVRIQQCIDHVRRANGVDEPLAEEDLLWNRNNNCSGPSPMEKGSFLHLSRFKKLRRWRRPTFQ